MYNNFSSKKTKKVISALLASALVVTSGPITADAATAKVVGVKKSITVSASATNKVTGLSKAEKKVVKVTKKGKKFTIKGLKAGKATFKIGKKSYTVKVGATTVKAAKTKLTLTKGKKATLKFTTKSGNGDTLTFKASNKNVTLAKKSAKIAKSAASVKATAKKAGKTTITATSKATGKKATVTVTVKNAAKPATTTPGASNTPVATATGSATNTPEATATATATASGSATNTPDVTATPVATATATPVATGSATNTPEATEVPTEAPTKAPEVVTGGTITVTGAVTGASVKVVSGTTVVAETTATSTTAKLPNVANGTYTLVVTNKGYKEATSAVVVNGNVDVAVTLEKLALNVTSVSAYNGTKEADIQKEVYATTSLKIAFSDDADSTTINTANVYLTQNGVKQLATVTYDATNKEATLTLTGSFLQGKEYILTVDGVKSVDGAEFAKYTTSFVTAQEVSVIAGKFYHNNQALGTSVSVATEYNGCDSSIDGGSINDTNEAIFVKFANAMDDNTLNTTNIKIYDKTDDRYLTLNCTLTTENGTTGTKNVVKIQPNNDAFVSKHEYVLTLNNAILDVAGNKLLPYTATFFCNGDAPDYKAGTVSPENAQVGVYPKLVPGDGHRAFAWSVQIDKEELDPSTVNTTNIYMTNKDTDTTVPTKVEYSAASGFLTITPLSDLDENVTYTVTIKDVKGKNGLRLPDKKDGTAYSFTTGDFTKPTVVSVTPANAAEGVKITDSIVINFSEKVNSTDLSLGTNIRLVDASNSNTKFANFGSWTKEISADGKTLTITPAEDKELLPNRTYKLIIEKGVINDAAGNTVDEKTEIVFTTANTATTVAKSLKADAFGDTGVEVKDGDTDVKKGVQYFYINYSSALKGNVANTYQLENLVKVERYVAENGRWVPVTVAAAPGLNTVGVALDNAGKSIKITAPSDYTDDGNTAIVEGDWSESNGTSHTVTTYDNKFVDDTQYRITLPSTIKDSNDNAVEAATYTFTIGSKPVMDTAKSYPEAFNGGTPYKAPYLAVVLSDTESKLQDTTLNKDTVKIVKKSDGTVAEQYALAYTNVKQDKITGTVINNPGAGVVTSIQVAGASQNSQTINVDGVNDIRTVLKVGDTIKYGSGSTTTITALSANSITTANAMTPGDDDYVTITACAGNTIAVDGNSALSTLKVGDIVDVGANNVAVVTSVDSATRITLDRAIVAVDNTNIKVKTGVVYKLKTDEALDQNTEYQVVVSGVKDIAGNPVSDTKYTFKTDAEVAKLAVTSCTVADGDTNVATGKKIAITFNEEVQNVTDKQAFVDTITNSNTTRILFKEHGGSAVPGTYELSSDKKTITFLPNGYLKEKTIYDVEIGQKAASSAGAMKEAYKFSFKTEEKSSAAITSAVLYEAGNTTLGDENDILRLTFNTESVENCNIDSFLDFEVKGGVSTLGTFVGTATNIKVNGNVVDIKLGASASISAGLSTIKVVNTDTTDNRTSDAAKIGTAATFTTDAVTITSAK